MLGVNENNVEDLDDAESSSMPDKYRIHMDGDNIYVIYASPSQSSDDTSVNSKIDTIITSPIASVAESSQQQLLQSSEIYHQIEYNPPPQSSFPSVIETQPPASLSSSSSTSSSHFFRFSSFKTVVQPESIKTYRAGSEDDSGNYPIMKKQKS